MFRCSDYAIDDCYAQNQSHGLSSGHYQKKIAQIKRHTALDYPKTTGHDEMIAIYCFYQIHYQHYVAMPNSANMANKCKCGKSDQNVLPPTQSISNTKIGFTSCGETKMEKSVTNVYSAFTKTCSSPQTLYVRSYSFMHSTATHIIAVMFDVDFYFSFFFVSGKLHIENVQFVIEIAICGFV